MANTYTQAYFHLVFAVKNRKALIRKTWKDELERYITGIIQNHKHKVLAINTMPDHIHIFIGYHLGHLIPDLIIEIKTSSNKLIKDKKLSRYRFEWQEGYGAFTNSRSQIERVVKYIKNQEKHHQQQKFKDEYLEILSRNEIEFSEQYIFDFFQDVSDWEDDS